MPHHSGEHHRHSIRLPGYDYSLAGAYFVTIVTQDRVCLFGSVVQGEMMLNDIGRLIERRWHEIPSHFSNVRLDAFVIMPNHIHGIIIITDVGAGLVPAQSDPGATTKVAPTDGDMGAPTDGDMGAPMAGDMGAPTVGNMDAPTTGDMGAPTTTTGDMNAPTVGDIVGAFKSLTTVEYIRGVKQGLWPPLHKRLWQRNYYERIIRNERELAAIRQYIHDNPSNWCSDAEYPTGRQNAT